MHHQEATIPSHHRLASHGAYGYGFQQPQLYPFQPHQYVPQTSSSSSNNNNHYHHGKKPSLAAFDPFSSSAAAPSVSKPASSWTSSPVGRDSAPTLGDASADSPSQQRQPVTPPSTGRPIAINNYVYQTPVSSNSFERFDNENTPKNQMVKTVSKLLRRASGGKVKKVRDNGGNASPGAAAAPRVLATANKNNNGDAIPVIATMEGKSKGKTTEQAPGSAESSPSNMAQELLELKDQFGDLQIPSLQAKTAPTSFLTGKGDEAVTTTNEPTPFQLEIPSLAEVVTMTRLNEFVENYRRHDQNLDLRQFKGLSRMELQHRIDSSSATNNTLNNSANTNTMVREHVPIIQSLLECSDGGEISIQGFLTEAGDLPADSRAEAVIFQGQRNFTVVFRGTTEQQSKVLGSSKSKKRAVPLDPSPSSSLDKNVEVYSGFLETYSRVEAECFQLVDKLVDDNPFCDVVFSGYSFGAAMATLAATKYAKTRPMMRVGCLTLASPKVGFSTFRHVVHTMPNLRVVRLELAGHTETMCQGPTVGGWHAGHTLVLNGCDISSPSSSPRSSSPSSSPEKKPSVSVYKFETPIHKNVGGFFKTSNPGLKKYISTLEDLATLQKNRKSSFSWPKDFANNAGEGVVVNNEKRLVV
jgi:hypothetical protein